MSPFEIIVKKDPLGKKLYKNEATVKANRGQTLLLKQPYLVAGYQMIRISFIIHNIILVFSKFSDVMIFRTSCSFAKYS